MVDDHSTDESWGILEEYAQKDKRYRIIRRPERLAKGGNVCRNYALGIAEGAYCVFLDSDDVFAPYCLSQRMDQIRKNPELDFWAFPTALFEENVSDSKFLWNKDNSSESDLCRFLRMDALWQTSGPVYSRNFLVSVNGLSPKRKFWQDYELHIKALIKARSYQKHFDLFPDVFIRNGDHTSLSRSTPFTGNLSVLIERIEFLEEAQLFADTNGKELSGKELHSLFSFKYFLILQLWLKHGRYSMFYKKWLQYSRLYGLPRFYRIYGLIDSVRLKINKKFKMDIKLMKHGYSVFPDYQILEQVQIGIHQIQE